MRGDNKFVFCSEDKSTIFCVNLHPNPEKNVMGKKATLYLCDRLLGMLCIAVPLAALVCRHASAVDPACGEGWVLTALSTPAVVFVALVLLVVWLAARRWLRAALMAAALVILHPWLAAMLQLRMPREGTCDLRTMTFNADGFRAADGFRSAVRRTAELLSDTEADVVCIQEFRTTIDYDTLQVVRMLGMPFYAASGSVVLLSRYPILEATPLPIRTEPGNHTNGALEADVETPRGRIRVIACHLQTTGVSTLEHDYARNGSGIPVATLAGELSVQAVRRASQIETLVGSACASDCPVVLAGDFNDPPATYTYHVAALRLRDSFREGGSGWGGTFRRAWGLLRLDYVFHSDGLRCTRYRIVPSAISDHKPVVADLVFAPV